MSRTQHSNDQPGTLIVRPWGHSVVLAIDPAYKLKRIVVAPGHRLSLQRHQHRHEHWYVVAGRAQVELDGSAITLGPGQAVDVPALAWHRLANEAPEALVLLEIQCGSYFGEDDIERCADDYGRAGDNAARPLRKPFEPIHNPRNKESMKRAFIFDMDGTMVDNMGYHTASWVEFFKRRGQTIDPDEFFLRTAGRHGREIMREYISADLSDGECHAFTIEKEDIYRELYTPHLAALAGLEAFIAQSKACDITLAVATSAPDTNIVFTLDGLGLREHFHCVVGAADVKRGKPAPDVFLKAAERCGVAPQHCIVFEDAPLGVQAARSAGMQAAVLTTTMPASAFSEFDNVIASARDFSTLSVQALVAQLR